MPPFLFMGHERNPFRFLADFLRFVTDNRKSGLLSAQEDLISNFCTGAARQDGVSACAIIGKDGKIKGSAGHFVRSLEFLPEYKADGAPFIRFSVPITIRADPVACIQIESSYPSGLQSVETGAFTEVAAILLRPLFDAYQSNPDPATGFTGSSAGLREVGRQISVVAPSHTTVLLQGESGTGKELAARAIHRHGPNPDGPFISLNCAALPENLIESELFGHERGAFTGALRMRRGKFELANGGTLFLDEIGELGQGMQAKLLRALQERSFERLGGMNTVTFDARIVAATNRDLAKMVEEGTFRRDLFYRLNVFMIRIPPLRERPDDILPLAARFLDQHIAPVGFSQEAINMLQAHDWPGNVREVQNMMERAALLIGNSPVLLPEHLPEELQIYSRATAGSKDINLKRAVESLETSHICAALAASCGKMNQAAKTLGLTRRELGLRMAKYGISYKDYRPGKKATCPPEHPRHHRS